MKVLNVKHSNGNYNIYIDNNITSMLKQYLNENYFERKAAIITDDTVGKIYGGIIKAAVSSAGLSPEIICIEHGEKSKCMGMLEQIYSRLCSFGMTRWDIVIALGGGVAGDLAGFAAATYMRGVPFINIPTSLLAQVDSSIGGKVAVDLPYGKNLVGAFYPPKAVFINTGFLETLEPRYLHDGLSEVIKYGCIRDSSIIDMLEDVESNEALLGIMDQVVIKCLNIKKDLVQQDELDTGMRMLLNFGHTIGHGIEKHYNYQKFTHGEAIGLGMVWITRKSEENGFTQSGCSEKIKALLDRFSLPSEPDMSIREDVLKSIVHDKKASGKSISLVLLDKIGSSFIKKVSMQDIKSYI